MESGSDSEERLKNYYHKMAEMHVKNKNYKSAFVYFTEAAEKYLEASRLATREELQAELKEKCTHVIKKGEVCKKRYNETKIDTHGNLNASKNVKVFKDLSLKEQKYIFDNIDIYKEMANKYIDAFDKTKDNQYLHAVFAANREAAFAYILASKYCDEDTLCLRWNAEGKKILKKTEQMKIEISQNEKYDKWSWMKNKYNSDERLVINRSSIFNGIKVNPWLIEDGVVNIIQEKMYEDPDGFPHLSEAQTKNFDGFKRPRDFIPKKYRNPVINIGDNVSGFEVNQNSVGDCSVVASLALAGHTELKMDYTKRIIT